MTPVNLLPGFESVGYPLIIGKTVNVGSGLINFLLQLPLFFLGVKPKTVCSCWIIPAFLLYALFDSQILATFGYTRRSKFVERKGTSQKSLRKRKGKKIPGREVS